MPVASIKGAAFSSAPADVNRLVEEGTLSRADLELRLSAEAIAVLDEKISAASWYPIAIYAELVELLAFAEGGADRNEYWRMRGEKAAERLAESGIYQQLHATRDQWGDAVGKIIMSVQSAIYNFTQWRMETLGDGGFEIHVSDAAELPNAARHATLGFIEYMVKQTAPVPMRVSSTRLSKDRVVFRGEPLP
jgi:hypothetical protein